MTEERKQAIDFTTSVLTDTVTLIQKVGDNYLPLDSTSYSEMFLTEVWLSILLAYTLLAIAIFALSNGKSWKNCGHVTWITATTMLEKYPNVLNGKLSLRLVHMTSIILTMVLMSCYCAFLTTKLMTKTNILSIPNFETLHELGYKITVKNNSVYHQRFSNAPPGSVYDKLLKSNPKALAPLNKKLYKNVLESNRVLAYAPLIAFQSQKGFQPVQGFKQAQRDAYSFGLEKHSEFKEFFDFWLLQLKAKGILHKVFEKWSIHDLEHGHRSTAAADTNPQIVLDYRSVVTPFSILLFGTIMGLTVAICESMQAKLRKFF